MNAKKQKTIRQRRNEREFWIYYPDGRIEHHARMKKGVRKVTVTVP